MLTSFVRRSLAAVVGRSSATPVQRASSLMFSPGQRTGAFAVAASSRRFLAFKNEDFDNIPLIPKEKDLPEDSERSPFLLSPLLFSFVQPKTSLLHPPSCRSNRSSIISLVLSSSSSTSSLSSAVKRKSQEAPPS